MSEKHWIVADRDEQSAAEEREREQQAEVRELLSAIAEDHLRRDQMIEAERW
jgi:hypothetical protein